jgi:hypothetical protein
MGTKIFSETSPEILYSTDYAVEYLVKAFCYKPEGRGSIPDEVIRI